MNAPLPRARLLSGMVCVMLWPALAMAAEVAHGGKDAHAEPDPLAGSPVVTIVALVVFVGLFLLLSRTAYPQILGALADRENKIRESLEAADRAAEEASRAKAELEAQIITARQEASRLVEQAKQNASIAAQAELDAARKEIKAERERAQREIQIARDTALQEVSDRSVNLAVDIAGKIVRRELSPEGHRDLINDALRQMQVN